MKTTDLILRCYAEKQGKVWVAACVDLCLAAQDYELQSALNKLHAQIADHIKDAVEHPEHAQELLSRKAPLQFIAKFHWIKFKCQARALLNQKPPAAQGKAFCEAMPLKLA